MDKLRVLLLFAFSLVSIMLVIEYAKFRDDKSKESLLAQQTSTLSTYIESDSKRATNSLSDDDIPSLIEANNTAVVLNTDAHKLTHTGLINIETDFLKVQIDPKGGDIVRTALKQYLARIDTPDIPFILLEHSDNRTYIAQSGLIGKNGTDTAKGRPQFLSEAKNYYLTEDEDQLLVDLVFVEGDISITKRFTFKRSNYLIDVDYIIDNNSTENWQAAFYAQIKRDSSKDPAADKGNIGMAPYLGFATTTDDERFKKIDFDDVREETFKTSVNGGWIAMIQHYFLSAWIADANTNNEYSTLYSKTGFNLARVKTPLNNVAAGEQGTIHASFYVGPKDQYSLQDISKGLDLSVDYGFLWMLAQPLYSLMYFINNGELHAFGKEYHLFGGLGNWGFSIIFLTILVKLLFFGLNKKAYTSMAKMRAIQPKMLEIKDRYADDRQKQSQEMMSLYSKEGVNPVGGCLPMIVQMPVFIALYWVLLESVELRHAPFIGYIKDLSSMDPYFIMPLIMGASMFFQQKLNPPPPDPMQAKVMQFLPVVFTFFFLFFPAGLVLYWVVNNILSIAQQWFITRQIEANDS